MSRYILFFICLIMCHHTVRAQNTSCTVTITGHIDLAQIPANEASVYIPMLQKRILADSAGNFTVTTTCSKDFQLIITYSGYKTIDTTLHIGSDNIVINFILESKAKELNDVVVRTNIIHKDEITTAVRATLTGKELDETRGLSLGESLKGITGINSIQSGPAVSKPVIHGVYGNRILIMNNGVRQESQDWGNDHAPEIDPFIATKITIIKGAASIRYGSGAIGGVILVDPKEMPVKPGIDGEANIVGMTNGHVGVASGMIEGAAKNKLQGLSWRLQGTLKQAGNAQTPNYYIGNTGFKEDDYSASLNYLKKNYGGELYYSRFNTKIGIADASVIGSGQDFLSIPAEPAVKAGFTYDIERPYQTVNHQLIKADGFVNLPNNFGKIEGVFAFQQDVRKEYDASPSSNSIITNTDNIPDLDMRLNTSTVDLIWEHLPIKKKITGSVGLNFITHGNLEQGTTYIQLIPNFTDYGGGAFLIEKYQTRKWIFEGGVRYDYKWLQAYMLNPTTLAENRPIHNWQNTTINLGASYKANDKFSGTFNFGTAWRPPSVLELYADGIHQSAASFERGDTSLKVEKAYNSSAAIKYDSKDFEAELGVYVNYFQNYIYAKPDSLPAYTIDGQYPAFDYTQIGNALFEGIDFNFIYSFLQHFSLSSKTSIVRARNLDLHQWLINIPPDQFANAIKYTFDNIGRVKGVYIGINNLIVSKQIRTAPLLAASSGNQLTGPEQVYNKLINAPAGYTLWGAEAGCSLPFGHQYVDISLSVTNLTNVAYRDYLNLFRYYVDDLGRNISLRIKIPFGGTDH